MKSFSPFVTVIMAILFAAASAGCTSRETVASIGDDNIPKITIVAKRMTEAQKLAYDAEMKHSQVELVQR